LKKTAFSLASLVLTLTFLAASACLISSIQAQSVARAPISQVQMEKLLRVIDQRGENVRLNDQITDALGLEEGIIIRQASATDPVTRETYFFAAVPATGQYLVGSSDRFGDNIYLVNTDLRLLAAVAVRGGVQKIPLPEAGKTLQDVLSKFEAFLEMN
jgi:hypothetical protein